MKLSLFKLQYKLFLKNPWEVLSYSTFRVHECGCFSGFAGYFHYIPIHDKIFYFFQIAGNRSICQSKHVDDMVPPGAGILPF